MNKKTFATLAIIAGLLALIAILTRDGGNSASIAGASAGQLLLPDLSDELDGLQAIEITGAGDQRLVSLERGADGWTVTEQGGYPAAASEINSLLIALAEARIVEEKTSDPAFYSRLGVESVDAADAKGIEVALVSADGPQAEVILGDTYGNGQRYARLADATQSVLIDQNPEVGRDGADWVTREILNLAANRVQRVEITHSDGERLVIRKQSRGDTNFSVDDIPEGRELQYAGVANVTGSALQSLSLDAVARADQSLTPELATAEYWTFDGLVVTVTESGESDDDAWLTFSARFDADQAASFAPDTVADAATAASEQSADEPSDEAADETQADDTATSPVEAEAEDLNARLDGWRYQIAAYKLSQLTRRMSDLLKAPSSADQ